MHIPAQCSGSHPSMVCSFPPGAPPHRAPGRPRLGVWWYVALALVLLSTQIWAAPARAEVTVENWDEIGFALAHLDITRNRKVLDAAHDPDPAAVQALDRIYQRRQARVLARYGTTAEAYMAFGAAHRPALEAYRQAHPDIWTTIAELAAVGRPLQERLMAWTTARITHAKAELRQIEGEEAALFTPPDRPSDYPRLDPQTAEQRRRDAPPPFPEEVGVCLGYDPLQVPHCLLMDRNDDERVDLHDLCALAMERSASPCPFVAVPSPRMLSEEPPVYPVNQVLVRLRPGTPAAAATVLAQTVQGRVVGIIPLLDLYQLEVPTTTPDALDEVLGVLLMAGEPVVSVRRYVLAMR